MRSELLESIENQFTQINYRWEVFSQLYDSGQENIDLLNASGSNVFLLVQKLLIDDTMSALCRLTDPASSGRNKNASISQLLEVYESDMTAALYGEVESIFTRINTYMANIRLLRNKAMSHSSLEHSLGIEPLIGVTYDEIDNSIGAIRKLLSKITGNSSDYRALMPYGADGNKLLSVLAKAHGEANSKAGRS